MSENLIHHTVIIISCLHNCHTKRNAFLSISIFFFFLASPRSQGNQVHFKVDMTDEIPEKKKEREK